MNIYSNRQQEIAEKISHNSIELASKWTDWHWQLKHSVTRIETFEKLLEIHLDPLERHNVELTLKKFPLFVTPYYLSLIDRHDYRNDPIFRQAFPSLEKLEVEGGDEPAPLSEQQDSPAPGISQRGSDRVLFHISNVCAMYCRHCTRKRRVGEIDSIPDREQIFQGLDYIRQRPEIRDVQLSGGDPLMLNDLYLDWVLGELGKIEHVQVIRIGSRMPVVLPYRVTDGLAEMLKRHKPVWLNTHFNHPREITSASRKALSKLADAGIPLGNKSVLLAGVNDCQQTIKSLNRKLVENRVRPDSLYQCERAEGMSHFRTPVGKGVEIMEGLIEQTSEIEIPTYINDAPGGACKIPLNPNPLMGLSAPA